MRPLLRLLVPPVSCRDDLSVGKVVSDIQGRVERAARLQGPPTAAGPVPIQRNTAAALERDELKLMAQATSLPPRVQAMVTKFKASLDQIEASLSKGQPIKAEDLRAFRAQATELGELLNSPGRMFAHTSDHFLKNKDVNASQALAFFSELTDRAATDP